MKKAIESKIAELKPVRMKLSDIKPNPKNPRLHPPEQIERLGHIIETYDYIRNIVVNADGYLIAGHGVLASLKEQGYTEADVVQVNFPPEKADAFMIADNKIAEMSDWDEPLRDALLAELKDIPEFNIADTAFSVDEIQSFHIGGEAEEDDFDVDEALEEEPITQTGDLWLLGKHRVLCGDCTVKDDVVRLMDGKKADMVFTDPPYGVSYADKNAYLNTIAPANRIQIPIEGDHQTVAEMKELWVAAFTLANEVSHAGTVYYICSPQGGDLMMMMMMSILEAGWELKHCLIWVKNNHVLGRSDYNYKHEPILYGWKGVGHKFYGGGGEVSTWEIDKPHKSDLHPTMKPVALLTRAIKNSSISNENILDPFLGSGTTLISCEQLDRICYGMEIEPKYCDVIVKRYINLVESEDDVFVERDGKKLKWTDVNGQA